MSLVSVIQNSNADYLNGRDMLFPNKPFPELRQYFHTCSEDNLVFEMVRDSFRNLGFDEDNYGLKSWNPLGAIIRPGDTVLIKPNLVSDENQPSGDTRCLYTQANVVAAVIPYVLLALQGDGAITIGDAPVQECDFEKLVKQSGYELIPQYYEGESIPIHLVDLRCVKTTIENGVRVQKFVPQNAEMIDLGDSSEHTVLDQNKIKLERISNFDPAVLAGHHTAKKHEYIISDVALTSDVIINLPKPKSHRLAGCTLSMKNLVGIVARKESLPHYRRGSLQNGGDEYHGGSPFLSLHSMLTDKMNSLLNSRFRNMERAFRIFDRMSLKIDRKAFSRETILAGGWYGNDTIWRTVLDLVKIAIYSDKTGSMQKTPQRKILTLADMIICGQGNGPLHPDPYHAGIIAASLDMVGFDEVLATILGFDIQRMPLYKNARSARGFRLSEDSLSMVVSNNPAWNDRNYPSFPRSSLLDISPVDEWVGHIELP